MLRCYHSGLPWTNWPMGERKSRSMRSGRHSCQSHRHHHHSCLVIVIIELSDNCCPTKQARKARRCDSNLQSETMNHSDSLTHWQGQVLGDAIASKNPPNPKRVFPPPKILGEFEYFLETTSTTTQNIDVTRHPFAMFAMFWSIIVWEYGSHSHIRSPVHAH